MAESATLSAKAEDAEAVVFDEANIEVCLRRLQVLYTKVSYKVER